jgi:hypothetical protein
MQSGLRRDTGRYKIRGELHGAFRLVGQQRVDAGIADGMLQLGRAEETRQWHVEQAGLVQAEISQCPAAAVVGQQREAPAARLLQPGLLRRE